MRDIYPSESTDAADKAFSKARREAVLRGAWARARHSPASVRLDSFEDAKSCLCNLGKVEKIPLGKREVAISEIVGSVARGRDFDDLFLPLNRDLGDRWKKVYRAFQRRDSLGDSIPPVSLYLIRGSYFVKDGNHRVSVARFRGTDVIEAEITLLASGRPLPPRPHGGTRT